MDEYASYSSPPSSAAYSAQFFSRLTFSRVSDFDYPVVAPVNSVISFVFEEQVPSDATATVVLPGETILHLDDVLKIYHEMPVAFIRGKRSVVVQFVTSSSCIVQKRYHFSKVS